MNRSPFQLLLARVLLVGVLASAFLLASGFFGSLVVGWRGSLLGAAHLDESITDFGNMAADLAVLRPLAIAQLGILVLIATPVVRVMVCVLEFVHERDRLYTAITAAVLAILLASLFVLR